MIKQKQALLSVTLGISFAIGISADCLAETNFDRSGTQPLSSQLKLYNESTALHDVESDPIILSSIPYANEMLTNLYGTSKPFPDMSAEDVAKYLNHLVFNFCSNTLPHTGTSDINELFVECRTACGGYLYVLRGLLASQGITTRISNFYNLPQQGNHSAVEVEVKPGEWALFDPTFGTFFTLDGNVEGQPLSTEDVRFLLNRETISTSVLMAKKDASVNRMPLKELYEQDFRAQYMNLENYALAEQAVSEGSDAIVPLITTLNVEGGEAVAGSPSFDDAASGQSSFLKWTNETLLNNHPVDDTSYLFHIVGQYENFFQSMNVLRIIGLTLGDLYEIQIHGYTATASKIQLVPFGRSVKLNVIEPQSVEAGRFTVSRSLKSEEKDVEILISNRSDNAFSVFAIKVARSN